MTCFYYGHSSNGEILNEDHLKLNIITICNPNPRSFRTEFDKLKD